MNENVNVISCLTEEKLNRTILDLKLKGYSEAETPDALLPAQYAVSSPSSGEKAAGKEPVYTVVWRDSE